MNPQTSPSTSRVRRALRLAATALVVTVASHAALVSAQTPGAAMPGAGPGMHGAMDHCHGGRHGRPGMQRMLDAVGVNAQQREQMRALQRQAWEKMRPDMEQMRSLMQQRMKLLAAPTIDRGALEALRDKQMALADQISRQRTQMQYDMAQILTAEQRAKLYAMMQQRMERWQYHGPGMHGHGMGPMGGPGMMQ